MKKALRHINLFICLLLCTMAKGVACPNPGTYTIGPGGNYVTLTQALTDLNGCSLTGAYIFELQGNYSATTEIFPINVPSFSGSSSINNITIRPQSGTNNLSITSNNPAGTILLNGATFLTIDGRPGGIGSTKGLTIANTFIGNSPALSFINDASSNNIRYCNIRSANNGASSGTVLFGLAASGNGNDNNTIEFNEIWDAIEGTPTNAIYQSGSAFPKDNSNNNISNNNIYNYFNTSVNSAGMLLQNNASNWTINNNSFYQTASRTMNGNTFAAIQSKDASVNSISIKNNFIGGTQSQCGGTALTITGKGNMNLLNLIFGATSSTSIEGNTFRNISFTTTANKINSCINASGGKLAIGNANNPNQIGNVAANGNIKIFLNDTITISTVDNGIFSAIKTDAINTDTVTISSNQIGGIDVAGSSVTAYTAILYCTGNVGRSITSNNSINNITSNLNNFLIGIWYNINNNSIIQSIENNTLSNFTNNNINNKNIFYGILTQGNGIFNCLKNSIYNITVKSNLASSYSITGIYFSNSSLNGQTIEANRIFNLVNTNTTNNTSIAGICFLEGPTSYANIISKNFIHSLELSSPINNSTINGIHISSGNANVQNNMVRLGINSSGIASTRGHLIRCALESAGSINNFEHNSFYIGGSGVLASSSSTACIYSLATSGTRKITNNILMNVRSNAITGSNRHYGIYLTSLAGLSCNYNNIYTSGTDTRLGFSVSERATLSAWQTATSLDINSKNADPKFIAADAAATGVDLHINANTIITPIESAGLFSSTIVTDFDNETRSSLSPTDIGADAGNYVAYGTDIGIAGLITPQTNICYGTTTSLSLSLKNYYTDTINFSVSPVSITLQVNGPVNQTFNYTLNSGKLAAGANLNLIIPGTLDMSTSGTYTFNAYTIVSGISKDFNNGNDAMQTVQIAVSNYNSWKGINANWNDPVNWCNNLIPDSNISVVIPTMSVGNFYPEIASGIRASTKNITLSANTILNISQGGSINVAGELFNNGSIVNKGEIILSGNTNTNFPGNGILSYNNVLTIRKNNAASVVINRKIDIAGTLSPISGTIQLNDTILLISNKDTTANVTEVGAAFVYNSNGKFLVQRYIPAKRAWRLMTAPLFATENIYNSWQNKGRYDANNYNKGTLITGTSANPAINGLDISAQNQASMKYWDTALQRISNINNTLTSSLSSNTNPIGANNTGYFMFIRGDRNPANTSLTNFNNTTLESTGYLQTGAQTFKLSASSGDPNIKRFTLIGNPYAATIDFGLLEKTNIPDQFYAWDPQALDVGRYVTVINTGSGYISIPDRGPDGPNRYIQSGQAFFVETGLNTSIISALTIRENHKVATNRASIFRPSNSLSAMRINLYRVSADSTLSLADGTMSIFTDSLSGSNNTNPVKFTNINEMIGLKKNNQLLAMEKRKWQQTDTLFLNISKTTSRNYLLEIAPQNIPQDNSLAFLEDTYLQTKTPISLNSNNQIKFYAVVNNPSSLPDRFRIIFKPIVTYNVFNVSANLQDAILHWSTGDQTNVLRYEIQRSDDGVNFTTIKSFDINNDGAYQMIDPQLTPGNYYYRIFAKANDNREATSSIKQIQINKPIIQSRIFPNPAPKQQPIQIQFSPIVPGKYLIQMTNLLGQTIFENNFIETSTSLKKINVNNQFPSGIYQLIIWKDGQKISSQKLITE